MQEQISAADVFPPPRPKKRNHPSHAQNISHPTVVSACKGCISMNDPMHASRSDLGLQGRGGAVFLLLDGKHGRNAEV